MPLSWTNLRPIFNSHNQVCFKPSLTLNPKQFTAPTLPCDLRAASAVFLSAAPAPWDEKVTEKNGNDNVSTTIIMGYILGSHRDDGKENGSYYLGSRVRLGGCPHPVIVPSKGNKDSISVLLYSLYTTITGWGPPKLYTSTIEAISKAKGLQSRRIQSMSNLIHLRSW